MAKIYNIEKTKKTCGFEFFNSYQRKMVTCEKAAHGEIKGIPLCLEHFEYGRAMHKISVVDVTHER